MKSKCFVTIVLPLLLLAGCALLSSCSSDDDVSAIYHIKVDFQLKNSDGIECYDFKEGENVIFDLIITNNSDRDIFYGPNADIIFGNDLFCVYSDDGNSLGLPWTGMYCEYTGQQSFIIPSASVSPRCCVRKYIVLILCVKEKTKKNCL